MEKLDQQLEEKKADLEALRSLRSGNTQLSVLNDILASQTEEGRKGEFGLLFVVALTFVVAFIFVVAFTYCLLPLNRTLNASLNC